MTEPLTMTKRARLDAADLEYLAHDTSEGVTLVGSMADEILSLRSKLAEIEAWARSNGFQLENNEGYEDEDREDGRTTPYRWMNEDGDVLIDVDTLPEAIAAYDRLMTAGWDKCAAKLAEEEKDRERLREAVMNPGPVPEYHLRVERQHRKEWPVLWQAIDRLAALDAARQREAK